MMPMLTNPIFVNMTVVFVRLFYFEREFKGIRTRSKEQSRYRRNFTREMTLASGIDPDQGFFHRLKRSITQSSATDFGKKYATKSKFISPNSVQNLRTSKSDNTQRDLEYGYPLPNYVSQNRSNVKINPAYNNELINNNDTTTDAPPPPPPHQRSISFTASVRPSELKNNASTQPSENLPSAPPMNNRDIRFADLPLPPRSTRQNSIQASDIARSILTLERRDRAARAAGDDQVSASGEAPLVIKTVQEVEQEEEDRQRRHRHRRKHQDKPHGSRKTDSNSHGKSHHRKWSRSRLSKVPASLLSYQNTLSTEHTAVDSGAAGKPSSEEEDYDYEQDRVYNPDRDQAISDSSSEDERPPVSSINQNQGHLSPNDTLHTDDQTFLHNGKLKPQSENTSALPKNDQEVEDFNEKRHDQVTKTIPRSSSSPGFQLPSPESPANDGLSSPKNRTIRISETPRPDRISSSSSPKSSKRSPSSKTTALLNKLPLNAGASFYSENPSYKDIDEVLEDDDDPISKPTFGGSKEPKPAAKSSSFPLSFGTSRSRSGSGTSEQRFADRTQPSDETHRLKKIRSFMSGAASRRNSSSSALSEKPAVSKADNPDLVLKNGLRAKSLDHNSDNVKPTKSFEQMLNDRRHNEDHFTDEKEANDSHTELPDYSRFPFSRFATMEPDDSDFQGLSRVVTSNYLSYQPTIEGNSVFVNLSDEQKDELGGVEYRALKVLAKILVWYYVGWHILAVVLLVPWGIRAGGHAQVFESEGFSPTWWGFFTAASAFNNLGLTLSPDSMASFSSSIYILIFVPFFMIIGNTGFPVFLRFIIWLMCKLTNPYGRLRETLEFLLDHPRRCFTLLFPSGPTWWLFGVLVAFNVIDTVLFLILDLNNSSVSIIPVGYRIMSGFFQAVATRTTGFGILSIGSLHPAVLVSYTIMMYVNIFPVAMSIRHTNVYEEQTLGIYRAPTALNDDGNVFESAQSKNISEVTTHLMRQLSYDLWFMFIALFVICMSEEGKISRGNPSIPIFNILFEVTSAYGTVGLSTGYPNVDMSLSSQFSVIGKLVIIVLLYRGRHRSLPYAIDRAIILPTSKMLRNDMMQERAVRSRTLSQGKGNYVAMNRPIGTMASGYSTTTSLNSRRQWGRGRKNSTGPSFDNSERPNSMNSRTESCSSCGSTVSSSASSLRSSGTGDRQSFDKVQSYNDEHQIRRITTGYPVNSGASVIRYDSESDDNSGDTNPMQENGGMSMSRQSSRSSRSYRGEYGTEYNTEFNAGFHHKHHVG